MSDQTLFRLAGISAIAGGLLRAANVFATGVDPAMLQWDYILTDVFLLFALMGIYLKYRHAAGIAGLAGFAAAAIGLLLVRSARDLDHYRIAAAATPAGVGLLGLTFALGKGTPRIAGLLLVAALAVGLAGTGLPAYAQQATMIAGVLFGAGFVLAGASILRAG